MAEALPRLRRYAIALVGDVATADDLVQDCLERAWVECNQGECGPMVVLTEVGQRIKDSVERLGAALSDGSMVRTEPLVRDSQNIRG